MRAKILPSKAFGRVSAPPSKSIGHRALICAALTEESRISNIGRSRDVNVTLACLEKMGAKIVQKEDFVTLGGFDPEKIPENTELYFHESGSTLRFLIPFCMLSKTPVTLTGTERLLERPLSVYEDLARALNIEFTRKDGKIIVGGGLRAGDYKIPGDVSSQFITGLLFALSTLSEKSTLTVVGKFESAPYVNLTLSVLRDFGKKIEVTDRTYTLHPSPFVSREYRVEGDYSNAAFLDAFNLIGGEVSVAGLKDETLQGDAIYREFFPRLKKGFDSFDLSDCPDTAPVLFALAAALNGGEFTGTARLKIKESDRAEAMREELSKMGVDVLVEENRVVIPKSKITPPKAPISSHNDHRIAMAMALLLTVTGGEIEGADAVNKSFPDFWDKLRSLQIKFDIYA